MSNTIIRLRLRVDHVLAERVYLRCIERAWEIASSGSYLVSHVSSSLPASAGAALPMAKFGSNSATFGPLASNAVRGSW